MTKFLGMDTSSHSCAYALIDENGTLLKYGEFYFEGKSVYQRMTDALFKTEAMFDELDADYVCIEEAVRVVNIKTAITMAKFVGIVCSVLGKNNPTIIAIQPLVWQSYIGNPILKAEEKRKLLIKHKELKTKSQQQTFIRSFRKNRTIEWCKKTFGIDVDNDNISDAVAIAYYCSQKLGDIDG